MVYPTSLLWQTDEGLPHKLSPPVRSIVRIRMMGKSFCQSPLKPGPADAYVDYIRFLRWLP